MAIQPVSAIWQSIKKVILAKNSQYNFGSNSLHFFYSWDIFSHQNAIEGQFLSQKKLFFFSFCYFWPYFMVKTLIFKKTFQWAKWFTHFLANYTWQWLKFINIVFKENFNVGFSWKWMYNEECPFIFSQIQSLTP